MSAESFFERWTKRNADAAAARQAELAERESAPPVEQPPPPTLEDAALLTADSDFRPFVARGVDENIRRTALKKLFADPHFNVMDGLDVYMEDYNKFEPIPAAMLAMLEHAKGLLNPLAVLGEPAAEEPAATQQLAEPEAESDTDVKTPPDEEKPRDDDPVQDL